MTLGASIARFAGVVALFGCSNQTAAQAEEYKFPKISRVKIETDDKPILKLQRELFNEIVNEIELHMAVGFNNEAILDALARLRDAGMECGLTPKEKMALLTQLKEFNDVFEKLVIGHTSRVNPRQANKDLSRIRQLRLKVESDVLKLKEP